MNNKIYFYCTQEQLDYFMSKCKDLFIRELTVCGFDGVAVSPNIGEIDRIIKVEELEE